MTDKATPRPWNRNIKADGKYPVIFAGRNQHVCTVSQQKTGEETEANIDFIVEAVNAHDKLVADREALLSIAKNFVQEYDENNAGGYGDSPLAKQFREVIARVEGK